MCVSLSVSTYVCADVHLSVELKVIGPQVPVAFCFRQALSLR